MQRWLWTVCAACCLTGCRSTTPQFDPFAPYGPQRVPPPATGSIGYGSSYAQPTGSGFPPPASGPASGMQPVPSLIPQDLPPPPAVGSLPVGNEENWKSAQRPPAEAGASYQPAVRTMSVEGEASLDSLAESELRRADNLAWSPPFGRQPPVSTAAPLPAALPAHTAATYAAVASTLTPAPIAAPRTDGGASASSSSPIRPAAVRSASYESPAAATTGCQCDAMEPPRTLGLLAPIALDTLPDGLGPPDAMPHTAAQYSPVDPSRWQSENRLR